MATSEGRAAAIKEQGLQRQQQQREEIQRKQVIMDVKDMEMEVIVKRVERQKKMQADSYKKVKEALNVDVQDMKKLGKASRNRSLVQLMFCAVIMGCELDLLGFAGAFGDYWSLKNQIVQGLLVAMPSAYFVCIGIYMTLVQPDEHLDSGNTTGDSLAQRARARIVRTNVQLEWYHFLPLARYILLIKSIKRADIEGIFRVNSLSSFTLGSCQIVALIFTIMENGGSFHGLSMFVYMNMFSQMVNWTITIVYFTTSVSKRMQDSIAVEALKSNQSNLMRNTLLQLQVLIDEDAEELAKEEEVRISDDGSNASSNCFNGRLDTMRQKIHNEIAFFKQIPLDLRYFEPTEVLFIRRAVFAQFAEEFAKA